MIGLFSFLSLVLCTIYLTLTLSNHFIIFEKILTKMLTVKFFVNILQRMYRTGFLFFEVPMNTFKNNVAYTLAISLISVFLRFGLILKSLSISIPYITEIYFCIFPILFINTVYRFNIDVYLIIDDSPLLKVKLSRGCNQKQQVEQKFALSSSRNNYRILGIGKLRPKARTQRRVNLASKYYPFSIRAKTVYNSKNRKNRKNMHKASKKNSKNKDNK